MAIQGFQKGNILGVPIQSQEYSKNLSKQKLFKIKRAKELLKQGLSQAAAMRVMIGEGLSNRSLNSSAGPALFMKQAANELRAEGVKITPGKEPIGEGAIKRSRDARYKSTQAKSNKGMEIKMAVPKETKSTLQLSHAGSKKSPVGLHNLMYAEGRKNLKMVKPFEDKIFAEMEKFNNVYEDVNAPDRIKRLAALEYAKNDRALRKKYPEYAKLKTRLSFKNSAFAPGFVVKEKLLDPSMAISNEPGMLLKGTTPSSTKGKEIIAQSQKVLNSSINSAQSKLISSTDKLPKADQLKFCSLLSNGGLPGNCKKALKANPEKAAKILSEAPVTSAAMKTVQKDSQKLIRLFRGESFPNRTNAEFKSIQKISKNPLNLIKKDALAGQFFTSKPDMASKYTNKLGRIKYVDVTPAEYLKMKEYAPRINKTNSILSNPDNPVRRYPINSVDMPNPDSVTVAPRYKIKQLEKSGRMKSKLNMLGEIKNPAGTLIYNSTIGGFVDAGNPSQIVDQAQIKAWATDNPISVEAGTEDAFKPIKKNFLKTVGKTLAKVGAPLPTALLDSYFIGKQIQDDKPAVEIAKDPLNWLGLATMSTLTKVGGITNAGVATPGTMNTILRLGMSPAGITAISRLGYVGLAVSGALTAYDQYNKYQNEEGLIYNLFNDKAEPV